MSWSPSLTLTPEDVATLSENSLPRREHTALMQALLAGEEKAWEEFYQLYAHRVRAYLETLWQGEVHHLDDLVQETFLRAVKYLKPLPDEAALWSWLTVVARSVVADHGRKRSRFRRFLERFTLEPQPVSLESDDQVAQAMKQLDAASRELLTMKYETGLTVAEMACQLCLSEKAVECRLARARRKLRKILTHSKELA